MKGAAVTLAPHIPEQPHPSHDLRGLQTEARFDSLSGEGISNHYDGFGRLASSATTMDGTTRTLAYQYDRDGNRTRITHPDSVQFDYSYDGLDRPTWLSDPSSALTHLYEPWGTVSGIIRIGGASGRWTTPDGRLISLSHYDGPSFTLDTYWAFTHNPAGQIAIQWSMNDAYAWTGHYAVQRPYATNGLNQYNQTGSGAGTAAFTYDANGNLITQTVQGVTQTYVYDIENRLVGAPGPSPGSGGSSVVLTYDPLGRLYALSSPTTDTRFLYDGDALIAEYNAAGTLLRRYVHDIGADVPAIQYEGTTVSSTTRRYLLAGPQGSIVASTDGNSVIQSRNTYDEYGIPGAGNSGRFQYTGQIWLPELGMYHYKARVYSPTLGRFLQVDPVGYNDQFNLYAYVGNDPVNRTDPTGRYTCTGNPRQCAAVRQALQRLERASRSRNLTRSQRTWAARILARYGAEGERNRVVVGFLSPRDMARESRGAAYTAYNRATGESLVTLPQAFPTLYNDRREYYLSTGRDVSLASRFSAQDERGNMIADEGKHAYDQQRLGRQVVPSEWHPPGQDFRSLVSRAFGSASIQDMNNDLNDD